MRRQSLPFAMLKVIVRIAFAARRARVIPREAADDSVTRRKTSQTQFAHDRNVLQAERNAFSSYFAAPTNPARRARLVYFSLKLS